MKRSSLGKVVVAVFLLLATALPNIVIAQETPMLDSGDTAWMLTSTALVLFMTIPGLSLFYAGMVRSKNVLSVMTQCFAITCLVTVLWTLYLYSLAFGDDVNGIIGDLSKAFMRGIGPETLSGTIPVSVFSMFQLTFAIIIPALIVGAFAERMKFSALLWFMGLWVALVYALVAHWVWGGGWLGDYGVLDFAGGTVVHINAGIAGLVAALVLRKRAGYPGTPMKPNNPGPSTSVNAAAKSAPNSSRPQRFPPPSPVLTWGAQRARIFCPVACEGAQAVPERGLFRLGSKQAAFDAEIRENYTEPGF